MKFVPNIISREQPTNNTVVVKPVVCRNFELENYLKSPAYKEDFEKAMAEKEGAR